MKLKYDSRVRKARNDKAYTFKKLRQCRDTASRLLKNKHVILLKVVVDKFYHVSKTEFAEQTVYRIYTEYQKL